LLDAVLLVLLTPVQPATRRLRSVLLGCLGNRLARLVNVDFGVAGISVDLGLIIGLHRLGIAPAYPGIIGVGLGAAIGRIAPLAAIPISSTAWNQPRAARHGQDAR
jgi:hypothetical protein